MNIIKEILEKASDRIKRGVRTNNSKKVTAEEAQNTLKTLLARKDLNPDVKKKLQTALDKEPFRQAKLKEQAADMEAKGITAKQLQEKQLKREADDKKALQAHLETNEPEVYQRGGKAPEQTMRSKSAEKLSGGVKRKMATGEGIAVRDKKFGEALDFQRRLKSAEQQMQDSQKPDTIRVSNAPEIPEEHKNDPTVKALLHSKTLTDNPDHHEIINDHINQHLSSLSSPASKE